MRKNCYLLYGLLFFLISFELTGCNQKSNGDVTNHEQNSMEEKYEMDIKHLLENTPSHYDKSYGDDFKVNADIIVPVVEKTDVLFAEYQKFEKNKVLSTFYNGKKPKENIEEEMVSYQDDNSRLAVEDGHVLFENNNVKTTKFVTENFASQNDIYNLDKKYSEVYRESSLNFMSKEKALNNLYSILDKMQIQYAKKDPALMEIYSVDCNSMKTVQEERIQSEINMQKKMGVSPLNDPTEGYITKETYTYDDEFYIIYYSMIQDGIPVTEMSYDILDGERIMNGSFGSGFVSKEGVIKFECSGVYKKTGVADSPTKILSLTEAVQAAYDDYDSVISSDHVLVNRITFEYVPVAYNDKDNEVKLVPAWSFRMIYQQNTLNEEKASARNSENVLFINAVTGEKIK